MKLSHIDKEFNFSDEINQSIETLNNKYKSSLKHKSEKVRFLKDKLVEFKAAKESKEKIKALKAEIKEAISDYKLTSKALIEEGKVHTSKLKAEYKEMSKEVKVIVKNNEKEYLEKFNVEKEELKSKYLEQKNSLESKKQNLTNKAEISKINEEEKGIDIQYKRARKKLQKDKYANILEIRRANIELVDEFADNEKDLIGYNSFITDLTVSRVEKTSGNLVEKTVKDRAFWISKISLICFAVLVLLYVAICSIGGIPVEYQKILTNSSIIITVALGGVFIYSQKGFDMSLGGAVCLASICAALTWNKTQNILLTFSTAILVGIVVEVMNSTLANMLKLPVMVATLAMNSVLSSINTTILESDPTQTIKVSRSLAQMLNQFWFYLLVVVVFFMICAFIFNRTPMGRRNKMLGCNKISSVFSGVNASRQGLYTFIIAGVAVGVGAILNITQTRVISTGTGSTIGLDVILAVVFGGMQVTGGPKSKISAAIVGGLTATLISYILIALGRVLGHPEISSYETFVKGALFLVIVFVNQIGIKTDRLPAIEMMW